MYVDLVRNSSTVLYVARWSKFKELGKINKEQFSGYLKDFLNSYVLWAVEILVVTVYSLYRGSVAGHSRSLSGSLTVSVFHMQFHLCFVGSLFGVHLQ